MSSRTALVICVCNGMVQLMTQFTCEQRKYRFSIGVSVSGSMKLGAPCVELYGTSPLFGNMVGVMRVARGGMTLVGLSERRVDTSLGELLAFW